MMKRKRRHHELLSRLAFQGRVIDAPICAHDWGCSERTAARELDELVNARELRREQGRQNIRCVTPIEECYAKWEPGQPFPYTAGQLSYRARKKWYGHPSNNRPYFYLAPGPAKVFGIRPPVKPSRKGEWKTKLAHDLGTMAVVLYILRHNPVEQSLRGEDHLAFRYSDHGLKCPDLFFIDQAGEVTKTAEYISCYPSEHVQSFIDFHREQNLPTEVYI